MTMPGIHMDDAPSRAPSPYEEERDEDDSVDCLVVEVVDIAGTKKKEGSAEKVYTDTVKWLSVDGPDNFSVGCNNLVCKVGEMNTHRKDYCPIWLPEEGKFRGILVTGGAMLKMEETREGLAALGEISFAIINALVFCGKSIVNGDGHAELTRSMQKVFGK